MCCADSSSYFQSFDKIEPKEMSFSSLKGRLTCFGVLVEKVCQLPFALFFKGYKTFGRLISSALGALFLLLTAGISSWAREFFIRRMTIFSKDLGDWLLFPVAACTCFVRLLLACTIHPGLYLKY